MNILLVIGIAMAAGLLMSRVIRLLKLPNVTAFLLAGLIIGPCVSNLVTKEQVEGMHVITEVALGFIAYAIGGEFKLSYLKKIGKTPIVITMFQGLATAACVDVGLILCGYDVPLALLLGAIALATAPAATLMVVRQYKADGPLTKLLMLVVAIDDAVGLVLFSVSFGIATALSAGQASVLAVVVEPIVEIVLSLGLGAIMGWLLNFVEQFFHSRSKRLTISVAFVLLTVGLSMLKFHIGPVHCGFSLLLVCMMTGTVFCNICSTSEELMDRVDGWTMPLNILFFVISGAELDLNVLAQPVTLLVGVIYILARSACKYYGSAVSCRLTAQAKPITDNLGITLLPQAGVALGMALTASTLPGGELTRNVVLFAVLVYELVGPTLTKRSLLKVGEIKPEGRTSARRHNQPKMR